MEKAGKCNTDPNFCSAGVSRVKVLEVYSVTKITFYRLPPIIQVRCH